MGTMNGPLWPDQNAISHFQMRPKWNICHFPHFGHICILHIFIDNCIMVLFLSSSATRVSKSSWIQTFWYQHHAFVTYLSWDITVSIYCTMSRDCWLVTARTNKRWWVKRWLLCYFLLNAVTQTTYIAHNSHHWIAIKPSHSYTKAIISYNANITWRCSFGASLVQLKCTSETFKLSPSLPLSKSF